jgi:GNAT superfamily N-acetyltransferase
MSAKGDGSMNSSVYWCEQCRAEVLPGECSHPVEVPGLRVTLPRLGALDLRHAYPVDVPALVALQRECCPPDLRDEPSAIEALTVASNAVYYVAFHGNALIGATIGLDHGDRWELYAVEVHPKYQGRGVGTVLIIGLLGTVPRGRPLTARAVSDAGARLLRRFPAIRIVTGEGSSK